MDSTIYLTNHSTLVSDAQMQQIAAACATQVTRDFAPLHGLLPVPVVFTKTPKPGTRVIDMVDTQDDPQALGWHTEDAGEKVYGVIGAKPVLTNGGKVLSGASLTVSSVVSHEVLEMLGDPWCTGWCDTGRGYEIAWEVGDPVQNDSYDIGTGVMMSNFVTLEWFNPYAAKGDRFDFMNNLKAPCTMSKGGYWVQRKTGREQQKLGRLDPTNFGAHEVEETDGGKAFAWGKDMPDWLKAVKRGGHGRSSRKLRAG